MRLIYLEGRREASQLSTHGDNRPSHRGLPRLSGRRTVSVEDGFLHQHPNYLIHERRRVQVELCLMAHLPYSILARCIPITVPDGAALPTTVRDGVCAPEHEIHVWFTSTSNAGSNTPMRTAI